MSNRWSFRIMSNHDIVKQGQPGTTRPPKHKLEETLVYRCTNVLSSRTEVVAVRCIEHAVHGAPHGRLPLIKLRHIYRRCEVVRTTLMLRLFIFSHRSENVKATRCHKYSRVQQYE